MQSASNIITFNEFEEARKHALPSAFSRKHSNQREVNVQTTKERKKVLAEVHEHFSKAGREGPVVTMVAPIVPIALMLGKADTAFKLVGGSSIVYNAIRSRIFGKVLRAVEYPDGELHSVKIYRSNLYRLKTLIAESQPPPFPTAFIEPEDVKQIAVFTSPHFTEPVINDWDVSALPENAWLFWSKDCVEEDAIPTRGVKLDGTHLQVKKSSKPKEDPSVLEQSLQDDAIRIARKILKSQQFSRWHYDRVIDMAIDRDAGLLAVARNFGMKEDEFRIHCMRLLKRRDPRSILLADGQQEMDKGDAQDGEGDESEKRNLEPQVELTSRE